MKLFMIIYLFISLVFSLAAEDGNESSFPESNLSSQLQVVEAIDPPKRSSMDVTLDDAAQKLKSSHVQERTGAAKLLGKYVGSQAALLLIGALDDASELVRRAALVSLVEHFNNGSPVFEQALAEKIFSMIGDPDVEVRREASALIPRLVPGLMRSGMEKIQVNGRTVFRSVPGRLREDLRQLADERLRDTDSIVRQNMLKNHYSLRFQIPPQTFGALLEDNDVAVLLAALDQVRMYATQPGIYQKIEALAVHRDMGVRAKLAKTVLSLGRSFPEYRKVLRQLTNDQADEIATLAAVDLARLGERVSPEMIDRIIEYLSLSRGLYGKAETLFYSLSALGRDSARIYEALLVHPSASIRAKAWHHHLILSEGWKSPTLWIPAMEDRDLQVRETVLSLVRGRVDKIEKNELLRLIGHPFAEVRTMAAELLLVADPKVVQNQFFELLIDEDSLVRSTTLRVLANLRFENWIHLHARSLKDEDYNIQRAAMDGLLGDPAEGVPALLEFVRKYPAERISSLARSELQKMGIKP